MPQTTTHEPYDAAARGWSHTMGAGAALVTGRYILDLFQSLANINRPGRVVHRRGSVFVVDEHSMRSTNSVKVESNLVHSDVFAV